MGTSEPMRRDGGVYPRDPRKVPPSQRHKVVLKYCLKLGCQLMTISGLSYWIACDAVHAHEKGYDTQMSYCPTHRPSDLPPDARF